MSARDIIELVLSIATAIIFGTATLSAATVVLLKAFHKDRTAATLSTFLARTTWFLRMGGTAGHYFKL